MTHVITEGMDGFRTAMNGPVILPGDTGFDDSRRVWNAAIDRRPAVIARCAATADVVAALGFAREHGLEVSVRGGAHNPAGTAVCDDGLMIDLSALNAVTVDPAARRARAGGGALLADLDAATQEHGLAVPAGMVSHTGVGGLTLGGGMGWLTRKYGLSIDNLAAADVVTADGRVLRASGTEHPDLFWAIRGGGGNFGVVTSFEFDLHELDPAVQVGMFFWGLDQGAEALRLAREITAAMPPDINALTGAVNAPPAPFVPEQHHLAPGYVLVLTGFGGTPEHARLVDQIRASLPPLFDVVAPMRYTELQQLLDGANAWGNYGYDKSVYLADLTDPVIDVVTEHVAAKTSPMSVLLFYRLDGAYCRPAEQDTAFSGGRSPRYAAFIIGMAPDGQLLATERDWVRGLWSALHPLGIEDGDGDGYINGDTDYAGDGVADAYGAAKYERLARVKAGYDPGNVFHVNANVRPAGQPRQLTWRGMDLPDPVVCIIGAGPAGRGHYFYPQHDLVADWAGELLDRGGSIRFGVTVTGDHRVRGRRGRRRCGQPDGCEHGRVHRHLPGPVAVADRGAPMQDGQIFLAGDAAHLITPAGGKGMNIAVQDAVELADGLIERYAGDGDGDRGFSYGLRRARLQMVLTDPGFSRWFARSYVGVDE